MFRITIFHVIILILSCQAPVCAMKDGRGNNWRPNNSREYQWQDRGQQQGGYQQQGRSSGGFIPAWVHDQMEESRKIQKRFLDKEAADEEEKKNTSMLKTIKRQTKAAVASILGLGSKSKKKKKGKRDAPSSDAPKSEPFKFMKLMTRTLKKQDSSTSQSSSSSKASSSSMSFAKAKKLLKMSRRKQKEKRDDTVMADLMQQQMALMQEMRSGSSGSHAASGSVAPPAPARAFRKLKMPDGAVEEATAGVHPPELIELQKQIAPQADPKDWPTDKEGFLNNLKDVEGVSTGFLNSILKKEQLSETAGRDKKAKLEQLLKRIVEIS